MKFTEQQLIVLRAHQLKIHEEAMIDILFYGEEFYLNHYLERVEEAFDQSKHEFTWTLRTTIYNIAKACIDYLFETLSYD
jgi:hypothetical protein